MPVCPRPSSVVALQFDDYTISIPVYRQQIGAFFESRAHLAAEQQQGLFENFLVQNRGIFAGRRHEVTLHFQLGRIPVRLPRLDFVLLVNVENHGWFRRVILAKSEQFAQRGVMRNYSV